MVEKNTKKGIPKNILREVDVNIEDKPDIKHVTAIVENHQVKLPVPALIRLEVDFKKGQKLKVHYDKKRKEIIYKL